MINFRKGVKDDSHRIAALHTQSWQQHYQGMLRQSYLDQEAEKDRQEIWDKRLSLEDPNRFLILAEEEAELCGFVCAFLKSPEDYPGALLDNIHVSKDYQGKGLGKQLFQKAAQWVKQQDKESQIYLWVLEGNLGAIRFYDRLGGQAEPAVEKESPGGGKAKLIRYFWDNLRTY